MAAVTLHLDIDDCVQDCPFARGRNDAWVCDHLIDGRHLGPQVFPLKIIAPPDWCPIRAMDNHDPSLTKGKKK